MRGATGITLQPHQMLCLPRKMTRIIDPRDIWNVTYNARSNRHHPPTSPILRLPRKVTLMIDPRHIWNIIYNARSSKSHPPTSPSTVPATKNDSHHWSSWHMKRHLQCAEQQVSFPTSPNTAPATQNCTPKSKKNLPKTVEASIPTRDRSEHDPSMIRPWTRHLAPARSPRLLFALRSRILYWKLQHFALRLSTQISPITGSATKRDTPTSPSAVPATKSDTARSPNTAPATKSGTPRSPNVAPATKNEAHDWSSWHMKRHLQCAEQQASPSNLTKYCACHAKLHSKIKEKFAENSWSVNSNARPIRAWSEHDPTMNSSSRTRQFAEVTFRASGPHFVLKIATFRAPAIYPNFTKYCACHEKVTLQHHQVLRLPRKVTLQDHQILRLPRKMTLMRSPNAAPATKSDAPKSPNTAPATNWDLKLECTVTYCNIYCAVTLLLLWLHSYFTVNFTALLLYCYFITALLLYCCVTLLLLLLPCYFTVTCTALLLLLHCYFIVTFTHCYFTVTFTALLLYCFFLHCYFTVTLLLHCYFTVTLLLHCYFTVVLLYCYFYCPVTLLLLVLHCYFTVTFTALSLYCYFYCTVTLLLLVLHCYFTVTFTALLLYCYFITALLLYCCVTLLLLLLPCYFTVTCTALLLYCYFYCTVTLLLLLLHV